MLYQLSYASGRKLLSILAHPCKCNSNQLKPAYPYPSPRADTPKLILTCHDQEYQQSQVEGMSRVAERAIRGQNPPQGID